MTHPYKKIKAHKFYADRYKMTWHKPPIKDGKKCEGYCNHMTHIMYINPNENRREFLDTILHESLHVLSPQFSEECVEIMAVDIAELLWKVGFRYIPDIEDQIEKISKTNL